MTESGQVERAARAAITRAKGRGAEEVSPDDLLVGALDELSRFGIAWIGGWALDVRPLDGLGNDGRSDGRIPSAPDPEPAGVAGEDSEVRAPAYAPATVDLFERAAALAREDDASRMGLVHLLAAFTDVRCGLMASLRDAHGFTDVEWRAALARGSVGSPPRVTGGNGPRLASDTAVGGPEILGVEAAAEYLGVHSQTVRNYIRSGKLPAYRLAGERYIRVLRKDLLSLLEPVRTDASQKEELD